MTTAAITPMFSTTRPSTQIGNYQLFILTVGLYANFLNIKEYLRQFTKLFNIITISETWINPEKGMDFELDGYEMNYKNREN